MGSESIPSVPAIDGGVAAAPPHIAQEHDASPPRLDAAHEAGCGHQEISHARVLEMLLLDMKAVPDSISRRGVVKTARKVAEKLGCSGRIQHRRYAGLLAATRYSACKLASGCR